MGDVEEFHKQPITRRAMNMVANPQFGADDDNDWGENDTLLLRLGQFPHESDNAFLRCVQMEEHRQWEA